MRPRPISRGKVSPLVENKPLTASFNEAATNQSRKAFLVVVLARHRQTSFNEAATNQSRKAAL